MQESDDIALLREFVEHNSEVAFAALVTRHLNTVYSIALRLTRNPHQAEEIAQAVFVILARKARGASRRVLLPGWLHETTRLTAITFLRSEIRRGHREREACMQHSMNENDSAVWSQIAPLLDEAMSHLGKKDRSAVVLRFFDNKSMRDIGAALDANEEAAKKRVRRAVEKLRKFFGKRGIETTAEALTASISENSMQTAPIRLASSVTAIAITKSPIAAASTAALVKGTLNLMTSLKIKMALSICAITLTAGASMTVALKTMNAAVKSLEETPGGAQTMGAVQFLASLQEKDELPGFSKKTNPHGGFLIPGIHYLDDKNGWQVTETNAEHFPISRTFDLITNAQTGSVWHYKVVKTSEKNSWIMRRAWRTDHNGTITDEFPVRAQ